MARYRRSAVANALAAACLVALSYAPGCDPDATTWSDEESGLGDDAAPMDDGGASPVDVTGPPVVACGSVSDAGACSGASSDAGAPASPDSSFCARSFGDRGEQAVQSVFVDPAGNITVLGHYEGAPDFGGGARPVVGFNPYGWGSVFVAKYDAACNHLWSQSFEQSTGMFDRTGGVLVTPTALSVPAKSSWLDPSGNVIAQWPSVSSSQTTLTALDRQGGIAVAVPSFANNQGGGGGGQLTPGNVQRRDPQGHSAWLADLGYPSIPRAVGIDPQGNVIIAYDGPDGRALAKFSAANGTKLWCLTSPIGWSTAWSTMRVADDGSVKLAAPHATTVDVLEVSASGCVVRSQSLQLPAPMTFTAGVDPFTNSPGLNGSVAFSPWGDVLVATANEHIEIASFARDGTLKGSGVYGRKGIHPAPAIASGPSGEVVLAGGFSQVDLNLGGMTVSNAFAWSTDGFFAKNVPYAALGTDAPPAPPAPPAPITVRAAKVAAIATNASAVFWVEQDAANALELYTCPSTGCGAGGPQKLGNPPFPLSGFGASSAGVFALGEGPGGFAALLRCPAGVCALEAMPIAARALAVGTTSLAFLSLATTTTADVSACGISGCSGGVTTVKTGVYAYPLLPGIFTTKGPVAFGWPSALSCPTTGCGTTPPAGTEWVTVWPTVHVATDSTRVTSRDGSRVTSCPFSGCPSGPGILASGLGPGSIATDGAFVYFFDAGPGAPWVKSTGARLSRCPASGCDAAGPVVLWTSPPWPTASTSLALAVDDVNVYFAAVQADGTPVLARLPK
jgi:hypothetical protein